MDKEGIAVIGSLMILAGIGVWVLITSVIPYFVQG